MRKGDQRVIKLNGEKVQASYLGKGRYATAWLVGERVYCFVKGCYMKEALCEIKCQHVPEIQFEEEFAGRDGKSVNVYSMPFYAPLTKDNKEAWTIYKELSKVHHESFLFYMDKWNKGERWTRNFLHGYANFMRYRTTELAKVPESVREALEVILQNIGNYGSGCGFEFTPRNLGVDSEGNIIFRDIAYDSEKI